MPGSGKMATTAGVIVVVFGGGWGAEGGGKDMGINNRNSTARQILQSSTSGIKYVG